MRLRSKRKAHLTTNAIETGKYEPSLPLAFKIARLFALQIEEVFDPDGDSRGGSGATSRGLPLRRVRSAA